MAPRDTRFSSDPDWKVDGCCAVVTGLGGICGHETGSKACDSGEGDVESPHFLFFFLSPGSFECGLEMLLILTAWVRWPWRMKRECGQD